MSRMFEGVTLSTLNYEATLIGWASLSPNLKNNVFPHAGNSKYSQGEATLARQKLKDTHSWDISDGGQQ